jgi:hypothetical protein
VLEWLSIEHFAYTWIFNMAKHKRNKKSLYEVMTQNRQKSDYDRDVESLHPEKAEQQETAAQKAGIASHNLSAKWWRKPRMLQFNAGKIEFSVSYPVAITSVLGIILVVLLAFRIGQYYSSKADNPVAPAPVSRQPEPAQPDSSTMESLGSAENLPVAEKTAEPAKTTADNVIVLVEYPRRTDLVPAQKHFERFGIETEIVNWGGKYFLITKDRFEGFSTGSDGYRAKRKIIEVGALYKGRAPEGYETFAPQFFSDAYGRKLK